MYNVYLLASRRNGTLYCGVTNRLLARVYEHKTKQALGFTTRYGVDQLVWFEGHELENNAITREKRIKRWRRAWKIALIEKTNPDWDDLYWKLGGVDPAVIVPETYRMWERQE
ncbi:GIY-YIG nuclease family protein [Maricaulis sp.]|uniref:GIY-YIG nuclease family protein n=1 Tax=Maricaulis sp. TaxID=1486257 RepID=UPI003A958F34